MKIAIALVLLSAACAYGAPATDFEPIDPAFDAYRDMRFMLSTRQNRNNPQRLLFRNLPSIQQSHYDRNRPTRFLIHGWFEDDTADISTATSAELLDYNDFNIIFCDWSEGSRTLNYPGAANRVPTVGRFVASMADFMHENGLLDFNRAGVIGFSLGAHTAGFAGKLTLRGFFAFITGLDPAGPLFSERRPDERISNLDAQYVEIIHTNGQQPLIGAGIGAPIGDADFWPNGGGSQPGCLTNTCSHGRAVDFYVESIQQNRFYAQRCPSRGDVSSRRCNLSPGAWMGGDGINFHKNLSGCFYLETNRNRPHAQGPTRPPQLYEQDQEFLSFRDRSEKAAWLSGMN